MSRNHNLGPPDSYITVTNTSRAASLGGPEPDQGVEPGRPPVDENEYRREKFFSRLGVFG
jgi:hypothetical protein